MKEYTLKPKTMFVGTWEGGEDERLVTEIRNAGWTVLFQVPDEDKAQKWIPNEKDLVEVDCPNRMVIVGKYRGQVVQLDAGAIITYQPGDYTLRCWNNIDRVLDAWETDGGNGHAFPTPEDLHEAEEPAADLFF